MILQSFDFAVHSADGPVYDGIGRLRLFPSRAMDEQVGIRDAARLRHERRRMHTRTGRSRFRTGRPFPDPRWRMIDRIDEMIPDGGPHGLGLVRGSTLVDPVGLVLSRRIS